ncbi:MAG: dihydrolipoyllysine succinyltransferase [Dethiosulfovibrio peptidovorans]|nr:MAG: dihydrolipoyllysine succinyltransferase [Dethiosulfovibrio peptidovorans]
MATNIPMPKLGLTMTEGTVSKWIKQEGDPVKTGEVLFVVSTDKITYEVQSERDGVLLKIYVSENQSVPVGANVAAIGEADEVLEPCDGAAPLQEPSEPTLPTISPEKSGEETNPKGLRATPKARKTAKDLGIDLTTISGSGPEGSIRCKDVITASKRSPKMSPVAAKMAADLGLDPSAIPGTGKRIMKADVTATGTTAVQCPIGDTIVPMTTMRAIIARRMLESVQTIPAVTYDVELDCTAMINLRKQVKAMGAQISYNDVVMMACARALTEYPMCNCSTDMENQSYIMHSSVNIGLAVAIEGGLLVPNVKDVQTKFLLEIATATKDLVDRARSNRLLPQDLEGGTFTITNLGMFGVKSFSPIVNPPESCILAINAMRETPVVVDGAVVVRTITNLCLTADHRSVDGADGAQFLTRVKELLESPMLLLL